MNKFEGTGVALITPFREGGSIDFDALERLVNYQIVGGTNYLIVHGTTGEAATLKKEEKVSVLKFIIEVNNGRLPIVLGNGGNDTLTVVESFNDYDLSRVDGILSVSPYYNKPTQEGIYQHYKQVAKATDLPIILYNVPGRTSSNMLPATTLRLANDFENIVAIKEASGNLDQISNILHAKPDNFLVISGDDALAVPIMSLGARGLISVVANSFPSETSAMIQYCLEENYVKARREHYKLTNVIELLFEEGNPAGVKAVLKELGICEANLRLPLWPVSCELNDRIVREVKKIVIAKTSAIQQE